MIHGLLKSDLLFFFKADAAATKNRRNIRDD